MPGSQHADFFINRARTEHYGPRACNGGLCKVGLGLSQGRGQHGGSLLVPVDSTPGDLSMEKFWVSERTLLFQPHQPQRGSQS